MAKYTDDFNRSDEDPLSDGGNWSSGYTSINNLQVVGQRVRTSTTGSSDGVESVNSISPGEAEYAQITVKTLVSSNETVGVVVRCSAPSTLTCYYAFAVGGASGGTGLSRYLSGTYNAITSEASTTWASGDKLLITVADIESASGVQLRVFRNGVQILAATDTNISGAGRIGASTKAATITDAEFDDFEGGDLTAAVLYPDGDGTTTGWSHNGGGTFAADVAEDPSSNDGDTSYILSPNGADGTIWLTLDNPPTDFDIATATSVKIRIAAKFMSSGDDTQDFYLQLVKSDESTAVTVESDVCNITDTTQYVVFERTVSISSGLSLADWQGARVQLRQAFTRSGMADTTCQVRVSAVEVDVSYVPASPTLNATITEGAAAADSPSASMAKTGAISEGAAAADTPSASKQMAASLSEGAAAADTPAVTVVLFDALTEDAAAVDSLSATKQVAGVLSEDAAAVDSPSASKQTTASLSEGAAADDAISGQILGGTVFATLSEGAAAADQSSASSEKTGALTEGAEAADTASATKQMSAVLSEGAAADDQVVGSTAGVDFGSLSEGAAATDTPSASVAKSGTLSEGAVAADAPSATSAKSASLSEGAAAEDSIQGTTAVPVYASLSEGAAAADQLSSSSAKAGVLAEQAPATDQPTASKAMTASLSEGAAAEDVQVGRNIVPASLSEGASAADLIEARRVLYAAVSEAAEAGDSLSAVLAKLAQLSEGAAASDFYDTTTGVPCELNEGAAASDRWVGFFHHYGQTELTEVAGSKSELEGVSGSISRLENIS